MPARGIDINMDTNERQRRYVESQKAKGNGLGVVFADAFLRGMRDIGYKSPAWALAEMIDNAIQASATKISIHFAYGSNNSKAKPDEIALLDNGAGMIPDMIGYAVRWGGTDREGDRKGFGRYGYGLPSSAVSLAKKYSVYSKVRGGEWHKVTVDIQALADAASDLKKTEALLSSKPTKLPKWISTLDGVADQPSGTVILLEDLDRLKKQPGWIMTKTLQSKLLQHFGVIYRHWLPNPQIYVDGAEVQVVDPLFLMEHGRYFDETSVRAIRIDTRTFEVETSQRSKGTIRIRASLLPPTFQLADPTASVRRGSKTNKRFEIMKDYNGLLICREGRQIDCIPPRFTQFQVYDRNVKIEIDFDPELDEYFGITTAKQQIVIDEEMWEKLENPGRNGGALRGLVKDMRSARSAQETEVEAEEQNQEGEKKPRASEAAMAESEKFKAAPPHPSPAKIAEARRTLQETAESVAKVTGKTQESIIEELTARAAQRKFEVEFKAIEEGPFYQPKRLGEQKRLIINTHHPFYTKVYDAAPEVRAALEVLLLVLAEAELEAEGERETFYKAERQRWSERLRHALEKLISDDSLADKRSAVAEELQINVEQSISN
jgi:hypothetical protein